MTMSPRGSASSRQMIDEARMKARMAKWGQNPGPGSYDPKQHGDQGFRQPQTNNYAGSMAFKSKSDRTNENILREAGDPGAYEPYSTMNVASKSAQSFNRSQQTGAGGFGTKSKRAELSVATDSPGPGTYDGKLPTSPEAKQGSSFASQTKRGAYIPKTVTPGAGEYDPRESQQKLRGGDSMFKNRHDRFKMSMDIEVSRHVGPGSYGSGSHNTIASRYQRNRGKVSGAFASTSLRGDMFMGGP
eukprot:CAMPEP_0174717508 /NCGR_PEP_ID=MMETSP1094-20130205/26468_1 /TAXON_ID=156173 /ORGANISM="Chrysochromulina brevifilum, Strain UTEX LB 985" /LENGTH=243 /DNA_ID=CAMNT_0015917435 /DNA_START=69 /DNA_END=800 /DNA_ORIENTATION=-